ncbi:MAG: glycosyltransferase family 2 protein [Pseudomonadota bacterium]
MNAFATAILLLAVLPLALVLLNLPLFRAPKAWGASSGGRVSILIPARNEDAVIGAAVDAARASDYRDLEVIVHDDGSTDGTAEQVRDRARRDPRVRLLRGRPLPAGWSGKTHACAQLAEAATGEWLVFVDADVVLHRDAVPRLVSHAIENQVDLLSGIPGQRTETLGEKLIVPLIHFVLLGFLPMIGMRYTRRPAFATGIGQLFLARATAYRSVGGHTAIAGTTHDGLALPRQFRLAGHQTDLADVTDVARCRMYPDFRSLWNGFAKNAHEGMGSPTAIVPWTVLLFGGHVLPWIGALATGHGFFVAAAALSLATRMILTVRFRQSLLGALFHPLGVLLIVTIQWYGLGRRLLRNPVTWKGRVPA